jgi:hypothetical protein
VRRPVKASETFCVSVCGRPTRKKSPGQPRNPKRCELLCIPMAKVERERRYEKWFSEGISLL